MLRHYSADQKRALYREIVGRLVKIGIRKDDLMLAVAENGYEDWFAGRLYSEWQSDQPNPARG